MKGKNLALIVASAFLSYAPLQSQSLATITSTPTTEANISIKEPLLLAYELREEKKGKQKNIGEVYIREHTIEAEIRKFGGVTASFSQLNDSTYQEQFGYNLLGIFIGETYDYCLRNKDFGVNSAPDSAWYFDAYTLPVVSNNKKEELVGSSFSDSVQTQQKLFSSLLEGSLGESTAILLRAYEYTLELLANQETPIGRFMRFQITGGPETDNMPYSLDDPIDVFLDYMNVPVEIHTILNHRTWLGKIEKIPAQLVLTEINRKAISDIYGKDVAHRQDE